MYFRFLGEKVGFCLGSVFIVYFIIVSFYGLLSLRGRGYGVLIFKFMFGIVLGEDVTLCVEGGYRSFK